MIETLSWTGESLRLLDQTRLPTETVYVEITDERQTWDAIKRLVVRGAPAIGVAAALGAYLGIQSFSGSPHALMLRLSEVCDYLATSRPTAVNLFWAMKRIQRVALAALNGEGSDATTIKRQILDECLTMIEEDKSVCRAIGKHGAELLRSIAPRNPANILTHCNAGSLATVAYGTALAPIYVGIEQGMRFQVYADETRPLLQGSRITAYELKQSGVPVTVLCDNMAAALMSGKKIDACIVGTDRVAANGDVANKIGTMGLAILAKHFGVPFFVAAPISSIDFAIKTGKDIPIEHRESREVTHAFGTQTAPNDIEVFNPAFDVTPAEFVTAIITERGVVRPPYEQNLSNLGTER
ncbi:MAG TPA: S-methyl-5-thioribose-1-phosphate isomerase [Tepidisphaeraceae bacterium]|jgi:methylthioribose-1-phosphate isomerase|nr:S-methyl-5-thioribose-1-phosphate isomerase [Tepidisphaeraceae bacterium]